MENQILKDALLVYPNPSQDSPVKGTALSIFYVGAAAEKAGIDIDYVDERFDGKERIKELLAQDQPAVIGVSSMTGYQLQETLRIFQYVKDKHSNIKTVLGGVHGSLLPEECMKEDLIDFVVVGEGEETFTELVLAVTGSQDYGKIRGIYWKENGKIIKNDERPFLSANDWPFPMTEKNKKYFRLSAEAGELFYLSSRGCPYRCRFCYNIVFNRRKWRLMPFDKFKQEIKALHDEFKFNYLFLNDDNVGSNIQRLREISIFLNSLGLKWGSCIRANDVTQESIAIMAANGCDRFLLGVETGSERILRDVIGKDLPNGIEDIRNAVKIIASSPIKPTYSFMSNIPTETEGELKQSMDFADWIHKTDPKARLGFYVYAPYPGTQLFYESQDLGYKMPSNAQEWSRMSLSNSENMIAENLYYISGLKFRGDISKIKFPGIRRLQILPFELLAKIRWSLRFLKYYALEKIIIKRLYRNAVEIIQQKI